jgi:rhodanese-related sulfurtransferase
MPGSISKEELRAKMDRGEDFYLVETLSEEQYREAHLPGAIHLPPNRIQERAAALLPDISKEVVVYCTNPACQASDFAGRILSSLGYSVRRYPGGKQEWIEAGLPVHAGQAH